MSKNLKFSNLSTESLRDNLSSLEQQLEFYKAETDLHIKDAQKYAKIMEETQSAIKSLKRELIEREE